MDTLLSGDLEHADHVGDWRSFLREEDDPVVRAIIRNTKTGRPCGSAEFIQRLEVRLKRPLRPQKRGRSKQKTGTDYLIRAKP